MPRFSILIPHYKTGMMTAYTIAQILKYSDRDKIDITVIDNSPDDGSAERYLEPFKNDITIVPYPTGLLQSQGTAYDYALVAEDNEYFITLESDGFPVKPGWLDYYEKKIEEGYDCVGSKLRLSGGEYLHPCGAMYRRSVWQEAEDFCTETPYEYFPSMAMRNGFPHHLMVHGSILQDFLMNPDDYIELAGGYRPYSPALAISQMKGYKPATGPFHNGMGGRDDVYRLYGERTIESEAGFVLLKNAKKLVYRIGYEPGQWLSAYQMATGRKLFFAPTEVKWLMQGSGQQEYTLMESGIKHLWGITAFHDCDLGQPEIAKIKQAIPDLLYSTLPNHQKI